MPKLIRRMLLAAGVLALTVTLQPAAAADVKLSLWRLMATGAIST
jgi:hypothetical protein